MTISKVAEKWRFSKANNKWASSKADNKFLFSHVKPHIPSIGGASTLLNGIISYWKFDDLAGPAIDSAGANDGTVVGATQGAAGKIGTAYSFDGDDHVNIDDIVADVASDTEGTWAAWVNPTTALATGVIMSIADTSDLPLLLLFIHSSGQLRANSRNSPVLAWGLETDNTVFSNGVWTHIALVQNGIEAVLYVNGIAVDQSFSTSNDKTQWVNDLSNLDNARIGSFSYNGLGEAAHFNGLIDEVDIVNRAYIQDEITELYNGGSGKTYPF